MTHDNAVVYSFMLYAVYLLLPILPAVVIFKLFPDTKVAVSGPLQGLTVKTTGAFAAYVVALTLGLAPFKYAQEQITESRSYAYEGTIEVGDHQVFSSDQVYSRYVSDGDEDHQFRHYHFVLLLDHPIERPETISLKYWGTTASGGVGPPPSPADVHLDLSPKVPFPQRFRLAIVDSQPRVELERN